MAYSTPDETKEVKDAQSRGSIFSAEKSRLPGNQAGLQVRKGFTEARAQLSIFTQPRPFYERP